MGVIEMKNTLFAFALVIVALLAVNAASAALTVTAAPTLGSENQERGKNVSTTFTLTNSGNVTVSGIQITSNAAAIYAVNFSGAPTSLAAGASQQVTVNGQLPLDHPAIDATTLVAQAIKIATITVSGTEVTNGTNATSVSADLKMRAENNLRVKKIRVEVKNGKSQSVSDGDRVKDLKPGDKLTVEVQVENNAARDSRSDFRNARLTVQSDSRGDFDLNEQDTISLSADSEDTVRFSDTEVDDSANDGNVDVSVKLSGTDRNGALQGEVLFFTVEVNRQSHELRLDSLTVNPGTIPCEGDRSVRVDTRVTNIGTHDEEDSYVEVDAQSFGFKEKRSMGTLNEDDSTNVAFSFLPPKTIKTGSYQVIVNSYYDTQIKSDSKSVTIAVPECGVTPTPAPQPNSTVVIQPTPTVPVNPQPTVPVVPQPAPRVTPQTSFMDSTAYIIVLAVAGVIILLLLIFLIVKLAGRKSVE